MDTVNIDAQFKEYHKLLLNAKTIENDISYINAYTGHLNWLDKIENAFNNNDQSLLTSLIEQESRSYGWGFLPNEHGEKVEAAFWNLKRLIVG